MSDSREIMSRNLRKLIETKGIDQRILADYLGISEMAVSNWVNGVKYPRMGNVQKMADYFGVRKSDIIEDKENKPTFTSSQYTYLPTAISAGLPLDVEGITLTNKISIPDSIMGKWAGNKEVFILRIFGDSMDKVMPDGSLIALKPVSQDSLNNDDIVVFSNNHEYSVKRYYRNDDKLIFRPESRNLAHHDQMYSIDDDITIHGKVVVYIVELD